MRNKSGKSFFLKITGYLIVLGILILLPRLTSEFYVYLFTEIYLMGLFAVSFNILLGYTGLVSFGHAAYFGIGAYTTSLVLKEAELSSFAGILAAPLVSGLAALILGYFCVRLTRIYFAMLTLAFSQIVWAIAFKWYGFTGGDNGLLGIPIPSFLSSPVNFYYLSLMILVVCMIILARIVNSPFGRMLTTIRENPQRAESIEIDVKNHQLIAFIISAMFSGLAGGLFGLLNRGVYPDFLFWTKSAEVLLMTIIGGMYTFIGPAIGAAVLIYLDNLTTSYTEYWPLMLGIILMLLLFFFPGGLIGFARDRLNLIFGRSSQ